MFMSSEICLHNATVLTGYSVMKNCAVLIKNYKIIDVFNEARFASKKFKATSNSSTCRAPASRPASSTRTFTA